jgi:peptidoglycan hydrolase CwlO-like protein
VTAKLEIESTLKKQVTKEVSKVSKEVESSQEHIKKLQTALREKDESIDVKIQENINLMQGKLDSL